jgi:preprotein translocase subunit SecA
MKLDRFNKFIPKKKERETIKPTGFTTTVNRPEEEVSKISDVDLDRMKDQFSKNWKDSDRTVDPYFMQEIINRLLGPESEEYKLEIMELNKRYQSNSSRSGRDAVI